MARFKHRYTKNEGRSTQRSGIAINARYPVCVYGLTIHNQALYCIPIYLITVLWSQFWVVYVSCRHQYTTAVERSLEQLDVIKRMVSKNPDVFNLVTSAQGESYNHVITICSGSC